MKSTYIYIGLVVLIVGGLIFIRNSSDGPIEKVTKYDEFAQCLSDAGAKFYGAFWCPHCADQKELFDKSAKLPYVECSTPDSKGQTQICIDENIKSYPTWKFDDGSVINQLMQLSELAEKTNCTLPSV